MQMYTSKSIQHCAINFNIKKERRVFSEDDLFRFVRLISKMCANACSGHTHTKRMAAACVVTFLFNIKKCAMCVCVCVYVRRVRPSAPPNFFVLLLAIFFVFVWFVYLPNLLISGLGSRGGL